MLPLVSVVVPVYNVENYLAQCLDSLIYQTYEKIEIICVNDGSTDQSSKILENYCSLDSRIKIINQENQGLSAARNTGLQNVSGQLVVFVDSDDWLEKTAISSTYKVFENNDVDFVCYGTMYRYEGNSKNDRCARQYAQNEIKSPNGFWITRVAVSAWAKMYRVEFLKKNELTFPVGLYYEDFPFYFSCLSFAKKVALSPDVLYNYRIRNDSIMGQSKAKKRGMAVHHLYALEKIYQVWNQNGFLKLNKALFDYIFEVYVQEGWKYLHKDDKAEYISEAIAYTQKWDIHPRRYSLAYDLVKGKKVYFPKYRLVRSFRKKLRRLSEWLKKNPRNTELPL